MKRLLSLRLSAKIDVSPKLSTVKPSMQRRTFFAVCLCSMAKTVSAPGFALCHFAFKIKTKDGGIVGNVVIEASDVEAAKTKLMKRYPGCSILSVMEK